MKEDNKKHKLNFFLFYTKKRVKDYDKHIAPHLIASHVTK